MLAAPDDVYYSHHQERTFPVLRARFALPDGATFYVDPADGQLAAYADTHSRWNRWLFNAPHQLDFAAVLRASVVGRRDGNAVRARWRAGGDGRGAGMAPVAQAARRRKLTLDCASHHALGHGPRRYKERLLTRAPAPRFKA